MGVTAVINEAGGTAAISGYSPGANLALTAAADSRSLSSHCGPAFSPDGTSPVMPGGLADHLAAYVPAGRRGEAAGSFQMAAAGIREQVVALMRHAPFRTALEAIASHPRLRRGDRGRPVAALGSDLLHPDPGGGHRWRVVPAQRELSPAVFPAGALGGQGRDIGPAATAAARGELPAR
jgi:hypothetical protein